MTTPYQIGQYRIQVDIGATNAFYTSQPKITENCQCGDCEYFEKVIIKKDMQLFSLLHSMGVDLSRQPNINPDGICCVGPTKEFERAYFGYYQVVGTFTEPQTLPGDEFETETIAETANDSNVKYSIRQDMQGKLSFEFYLECEKIGSESIVDT